MRSRYVAVTFLCLCALAVYWLRSLEESAPFKIERVGFREGTPVDIPGSRAAKTRYLGRAADTAPTSEEQALASALVSAAQDLRPRNSAAPAPRATGAPGHLQVRPVPLSGRQRAALQRLRWGIAKDLAFRGDGADATVRSLSSAALALPEQAGDTSDHGAIATSLGFVSKNQDLFLLEEPEKELALVRVEPDGLGGKTVRFSQQYRGLEVWPGHITAALSNSGLLTSVTGSYAPTPVSVAMEPAVAAESAIEAARRHQGENLPVRSTKLKVFADKGHVPELAYEVILSSATAAERVFVSATSGRVLFSVSEVCHAGVSATAVDLFNQTRVLNVFPTGTPLRYYILDTSKPMYVPATGSGVIAIYDGRQSAPAVVSSTTQNGGYDPAAVSAAYNLGKVYDFVSTILSRNSFDGRGASIFAFVRTPDPRTGGLLANASWNGAQRTFQFGAADNYSGASDVVGHEFTHAIIDATAALVYNGESGALNESFSDILGEAFERYLVGSNDWNIGTSLRSSLRSMRSPGTNGQPQALSQFLRTSDDHGGVHANSGIPNYAFYLLAEGLPAGAIGFDPARNIFYRALTTRLNPRSDFHDLRDACIQAARELYGAGSIQATRTGQAFDAVEVFDSAASELPDNLTPPVGPDSFLFTYKAVDGQSYLGRREAALGDGNDVRAISTYPADTSTRPSVTGDGSLALFITATNDVAFANTNGTSQSVAGVPGGYHSVAISADGRSFAFFPRDASTRLPIKRLVVANIATSASEIIDLYLPVADGGTSFQISAVDEVDLSPDGQLALFDGYAKTTLSDGTSVQGWTVFGVDLRTKSIYALSPPLDGINMGNPAFSRTASHRLIFEADSASSSLIGAIDLVRKAVTIVRQYTPASAVFAYPRFSAADEFVVFAESYFSPTTLSTQPRVGRLSLLGDRLSPTGTATNLLNQAHNGISYRRGAFPGAPILAVSTSTPSLRSGQTGSFRITRTGGDQTIKVPLTFKLTGAARPSVDYLPPTQKVTLPAGVSFVEVPIRVAGIVGAGTRTVTLSLDPQYHYGLAANSAASIAITGESAPVITAQPNSQTILAGGSATLSVTVSQTSTPPAYQWYKNGVAVPGATARTLFFAAVSLADAGSYTCVITVGGASVTSTAAVLTIPPASVIVNLSIRTTMAAGQTLIVGAVISGGTKPILIRAAGPTLSTFGLQGMADPRLELYANGPAAVATNDDWTSDLGSAFQSVGAFGFTPGSKDSALQRNLGGAFTVQCKGTGPGTVLVEAYDAARDSPGRLVNVSARNQVGVGSDILIAGIVLSGSGTKQLLIRGVGPTLAGFGVTGYLADPLLRIFDSGSRLVAENDNWSPALASTFNQVGAFGLSPASRDAAILVSLSGGTNYTIQVAGANGGTGEALVEVYEIQ